MFGHAKPCGPTSEKEASMSSPTFRHIARLSRPTTRVLHADRLEHGRAVLAYWRCTAGLSNVVRRAVRFGGPRIVGVS